MELQQKNGNHKTVENVKTEVERVRSEEEPNEPFSIVNKMKKLFAFFTVEPFLICYLWPIIICSTGIQKFNMEKACRADLNYTAEICAKVVAGIEDDNRTADALIGATKLVADMSAWKDALQMGIPAIFILFIGAWSDRTGNRKALLLIPLVGEVLSLIGLTIATYYFLECPLWVVGLLQALSSSFTGGLPVALMGCYSYVADVTAPEERTFRIGVVGVIVSLGFPLGTAISGILTEAVGYYGIFGISLVMYVLGFIHTVYRIHDVRRQKVEGTFWYKLGQFFHPRNVWDTISLVFLSRGRKLVQILLVIWAHIVIIGPAVGEGAVMFLYALNRYKMDIVDLSLFLSYSLLVGLAGTTIIVTVCSKWLGLHDSILGIIATASKVVSSIVYGLAPTRNWFYSGPIFDIFGGSGITAIRSLGTKIVEPDQVGKMCCLIGLLDAIVPSIYMPVYNKILSNTLETFPGAVYILGAVMTAPDFIIFIVLYVFYKRQQNDVVKDEKIKEAHSYENYVTAL